jgi:two-component system, NarL family, invasion response regulator UvrY
MAMGWRILLIDDHVAVQRGLEEILSTSFMGAEFGRAASSQQALDQVRNERWDLAVVDLNLPGRGGLELIRSLKDEQPNLRVLVYSMHAEDQLGVRALRAGADGYLAKDSPAEEIPRAVRSLFETGRHISANLAAAMAQSIASGATGSPDMLSDREYQVLKKMASGKSPTDIAKELAVSIKTVSTYRSRILEKLNLRTTADLIRYAVDHRIAE